jgi:hypothetical protein
MQMSREHRQRVLENQLRLAAQRDSPERTATGTQLKMPLLVEVKCGGAAKRPVRRSRRTAKNAQSDFGEL